MIILYGSYARNEYVDFDKREEFGIITSFRSDYDILVVTSGISDKSAGQKLDNVENAYYKDPESQTPVQFINEEQGYFEQKFRKAKEFLIDVNNCNERGSYVQASFNLHQAAENYYHAICLVFKLKDTKQHNLFKLSSSVKHYSPDFG